MSTLGLPRRALLVCMLFWAFQFSSGADADVLKSGYKDSKMFDILIEGTITSEDAAEIEAFFSLVNDEPVFFDLNSSGGDVSAALRIGRLIRRHEGATRIRGAAKCYSSCALIFIAGVSRINEGELGLHRPYLAAAPKSREQIEDSLPRMLSLVRNYVSEMGVTASFYEQMVNTEPSRLIRYRGDEAKAIVPGYDMIYDELRTAQRARERGITTAEIRRREMAALDQCASISETLDYIYCKEAVTWGVPPKAYREREKVISDRCRLAQSELEVLRKVRRKERRDHPITVRQENCKRAIIAP